MPSDIDGDCQLKLVCLVSDTVRLIIIIILQVRESTSSRRSQEWITPAYSLLLLTALMHLMRTFIEESLCLWNLSHDAQKHVRFVIVGRSRIKHVTQKAKDVGSCWLFRQLYPV